MAGKYRGKACRSHTGPDGLTERYYPHGGCVECQRKAQLKYSRAKNFGISVDEVEQLFVNQGFACAIYRSVSSGTKDWALDHDHKTGKVRELLCLACNTALGLLREDPNRLSNMIVYIHKHYPEGIIASITRGK